MIKLTILTASILIAVALDQVETNADDLAPVRSLSQSDQTVPAEFGTVAGSVQNPSATTSARDA